MKNIILVIKGFIMGIANIIPGVSGGTLALTLGIYEKFIVYFYILVLADNYATNFIVWFVEIAFFVNFFQFGFVLRGFVPDSVFTNVEK